MNGDSANWVDLKTLQATGAVDRNPFSSSLE